MVVVFKQEEADFFSRGPKCNYLMIHTLCFVIQQPLFIPFEYSTNWKLIDDVAGKSGPGWWIELATI